VFDTDHSPLPTIPQQLLHFSITHQDIAMLHNKSADLTPQMIDSALK
jgi:hypothetical protein